MLYDLLAGHDDMAYVGFLFVCAVANADKRSSFVSKLAESVHVKRIREIKKGFILDVRRYLEPSDKKASGKRLLPTKYDAEMLSECLERIVILNKKAMPSIEGVIKAAGLNEEESLAKLGQSIVNGAEVYKRFAEGTGGEAYFREYDLILDYLKKKFEE